MKRWFSSFIGMILVCAVTIAQTSISLLPKPQLYKDTGKNFTMGKVKLSTPVLRPEWEVFIMNAGGEIVEHSSSVIEVELVPSIDEARLNRDEAYRLSVSNKRIKIEANRTGCVLGYADTSAIGAEKREKKLCCRM